MMGVAHVQTVPKEGACDDVVQSTRLRGAELTVMLFQVCGVTSLCLNRLLPATRWAFHGRIGSIVALVGLAIAGALCGRHASELASSPG